MNTCKDSTILVSRFLMSLLFLYAGYGKIIGYSDTAGYMSSMGVPTFLLPLVILLELGGGLALLFGFLTKLTSIGLGLFSIIAAIIFHSDFSVENNDLMLLKDFNIAGGLFLLSILGAGRFSIDHYVLKIIKKSR